jgi:hypothetical protein
MFPSNRNLAAKAARETALKPLASSGCIFCDLNLEPVKLRRRWVHHLPKKGKLVPCEAKNLKPAA